MAGKDGDLEKHSAYSYHKESEIDAKSFMLTYKNPEKEIVNLLEENRKKQVLKNRASLAPIVKTILFHGRQNIPLRGNRDDGKMDDVDEEPVKNDGNFRALLRFRVDSGDVQLEDHLKNAKANATLTSKTTANELIKYCGEEIIKEIIRRVQKAKFYSILFDETTDVSNTSQLSISLRYLYEDNSEDESEKKSIVREDFVGFIDLHKDNYSDENPSCEPIINGEILGQSVVKAIDNLGLNLENCVGIGCDGCSVNISNVCGAAEKIKERAVNSILCICKNHCLNLTLSKSSNIQNVRNGLGTMKEVSTFFSRSSKRDHVLKSVLGHKVKNYCETRWVERHEAILEFQTDLPKIAQALNLISCWDDSSTATSAKCLYYAVTNCEFIVTIHCLSDILSSTVILSTYLQGVNIDISHAYEKVNQAVKVLNEKRTECDKHFALIFENTKIIMEEMNVEIRLPRRVGRQVHRPNSDSTSDSDDPLIHWKRTIYIPILDSILVDIKTRFKDESMKCFSLYTLVPINLDKIPDLVTLQRSLDPIAAQYSSLLRIDTSALKTKLLNEILCIKKSCNYQEYKKINRSIIAYDHCDEKCYPVLNELLKLLSTLPISVATAERSFSTLRRLKTWMRSRMTEDRLTGLAVIHVHRDIKVNIDDVIDRFAKSKQRRMDFVL